MKILAFETSCDETGVAVVEDGRTIRSNVLASQIATHAKTGGIVPEIAAREHLRAIDPLVEDALQTAGLALKDVDAVAATVGPGLAGCLLVGANYAHGLALAAGLPFIGVNHLDAHVYANWLATSDPPPTEPELPAVVLVVSGAHSDLVVMHHQRAVDPLIRTMHAPAAAAHDQVARQHGLTFPTRPEGVRETKRGDPL